MRTASSSATRITAAFQVADADTFPRRLGGAARGGRRWIVDAGVFEYEPGEHRAWSRSTRAHDTLTLDDADQRELDASFRMARRARAPRITGGGLQGRGPDRGLSRASRRAGPPAPVPHLARAHRPRGPEEIGLSSAAAVRVEQARWSPDFDRCLETRQLVLDYGTAPCADSSASSYPG